MVWIVELVAPITLTTSSAFDMVVVGMTAGTAFERLVLSIHRAKDFTSFDPQRRGIPSRALRATPMRVLRLRVPLGRMRSRVTLLQLRRDHGEVLLRRRELRMTEELLDVANARADE